jgi:hypothetical protein
MWAVNPVTRLPITAAPNGAAVASWLDATVRALNEYPVA